MTHEGARATARAGALRGPAIVAFGGVVLLLGGPTHARPLTSMEKPPAPPAVKAPDDGLAGGGFYLEAATLTQDEATHHIIARGEAEVRYKGRVVRADTIDYDSATGNVTADGHVEIIQADGSAEFADHLTLDKDMTEGFATSFSARLQQHVQLAAARTVRRGAQVTEFDNVIYTPCVVCAEGRTRPTWSIRARRVVEDKQRETLSFKDAVVQVMGVGVLYLPVLQAADPTADRKSGLLVPVVTVSGPRGFSYEQPYYKVLSPSADVTLTPQVNSQVNPFLNMDFRKRFYSGVVDLRAGYTYDQDFTSGGDKFGSLTSRSYVLAAGEFTVDPAWSWGFTAEHASDPLIFDKYSVGDVFVDRGLYAADDRRLISQIDAVRQDQNSYFSIAAISVQGLRATDQQSTIPTIAPLIEGRWEAPMAILGGRLRVEASAVALTQDQSLANSGVAGAPLLPGVDSRRATIQGDWQTTFTFASGLRVQPFLNARGDLYNVTSSPSGVTPGATIPRGFGTVGALVTYPLIKQETGVTYTLEPIALLSASNVESNDPRIPNEDSADFELDETNLFQTNRSPGFDLYEGGQSATLGGRATVLLDDGRSGSILLGERFAAERDPSLPAYSGLQNARSDFVLGADATPLDNVRLFARLRLDSNSFAINRLETGATFTLPRVAGSISYLQEAQSPAGYKLSSLDIHGEAFVTRHWGLTSYAIIDGGTWRRTDFGVVYRDDCIRVELLYRHDETFNGTLGPTTSVVLRLSLATLGNTR